MRKFIWKFLSLSCICAVFMVMGATDTFAGGTYDYCSTCHPQFQGGFGGALHDAHLAIVSDCTLCHVGTGATTPVPVSLDPLDASGTGCVGCHGRLEDAGNDAGSEGLGAGLRQHHESGGISCLPCHSDTVGAYTPVGEDVLPPFYTPARLDIPISCEDNLDNDGDLLEDGEDPDCGAPEDYTISGTVSGCNTCHGGDAAGVTITLFSSSSEATVTTSDGTYSFMVEDGSYTVAPSIEGQTAMGLEFDPINRVVLVSGEPVTGVDFAAVPAEPETYEISGTVSGCAACHAFDTLAGVTLTLSGDADDTAATADDGTYSFMVTDGGYTVTPGLAGHLFNPASRDVTVSGADEPNVDFAAAEPETYEISGTVSGCAACHAFDTLAGVTLTLSGDADDTAATADDGTYSFMVTDGGYTVTPGLAGHLFNPASRDVTVSGEPVTGVDFAAVPAEPETYEISGTVSGCAACHAFDTLAGVTLTLSGDADDTAATADDGTYSFMVTDGGYTVTPGLAGHLFNPASRDVTVSGADEPNVDFAAAGDEPELGEEGCSHGFWKNHVDCWCPEYSPNTLLSAIWPEVTNITQDSRFRGRKSKNSQGFENDTLMDALKFKGGGGLEGAVRNMLRQAAGSLLNACSDDVAYPASVNTIITGGNEALASQDIKTIHSLQSTLGEWNELGCPVDDQCAVMDDSSDSENNNMSENKGTCGGL